MHIHKIEENIVNENNQISISYDLMHSCTKFLLSRYHGSRHIRTALMSLPDASKIIRHLLSTFQIVLGKNCIIFLFSSVLWRGNRLTISKSYFHKSSNSQIAWNLFHVCILCVLLECELTPISIHIHLNSCTYQVTVGILRWLHL